MQLLKNKSAITIALFLALTIAISSVALFPTANAVDTYVSAVYVSVSPDVIGVNQQVLLVMWTADMPPDVGEIATGGRAHWSNVGFIVTDPEGNNETITIPESDPVGGAYYSYIPTMVGTYTVTSFIPEQTKLGARGPAGTSPPTDTIYTAAKSIPVTFTVQEQPIQPWPEAPLPTGSWTRPINDASREWYVLAGNWLGGAAIRPAGAYGGTTERFVYGVGPESPHIIWTKPLYAGGIMDERFGNTGFETGHYQGLDFSAIIMDGKVLYSYRKDAHVSQGYLVVDLYTGETIEYRNSTMPSKGQVYNYESPNQHGGYPYLWVTSGVSLPPGVTTQPGKQTWAMLDAHTGSLICKIANVSAPSFSFFGFGGGGTEVYGLDGSICYYNAVNYGTTANPNYYLQIWNNTAIPTELGFNEGTTLWQWRPSGGAFGTGWPNPPVYDGLYIHDGNNGFSLNVSIPNVAGLSVQAIRESDQIIFGVLGQNNEDGQVPGTMLAINLDPSRGTVGSQMYKTEFVQPFLSKSLNFTSGFFGTGISLTGVDPDDGVILLQCPKLLKRWGYDLKTGEMLWESKTEPQNNYYTMISNIYEGKLLTAGYGGVILAYNITTGDIIWNFTAKNVGFESPYGNYPINMFAIADGKIYTLTGEHSITQPMWRGPNLRCINATDGTEIFEMLMMSANGGAHLTGQYMQMADGHIIGLNFYDNEIYCLGKGDSAMTLSGPQLVPTLGTSVVLTGTVTDQTPTGRRNTNDMFDFSLKGTPAISDEDMGAWMEYMFMDQGKPENAKGVPVTLSTLDSNGNFYEIGTTTSDINGNFGLTFTPEVPGDYQIFATFAGSKAYGASSASTYISIAETPQASPSPTPAPPYGLTADEYLLPATIGIIVAVVVVGLVIILMLRKR
jgi:hypothetical protein